MWLHFCFSIVFAYVISSNRGQNALVSNDTEAIFASVIKNISRVNNVLQDLIQNYEHLQKIYKSQENLEIPTSDDEIDEIYKSKNKEHSNDATTNAAELSATQMIWSDEVAEDKKSKELEASSDSNDDESAETPPNSKKLKQQQQKSSSFAKVIPEIMENKGSPKPKKFQLHVSPKQPKVKKPNEPATEHQKYAKSEQTEVVYIDVHKSSPDENTFVESLDPVMAVHQASVAPKTRYIKVSDRQLVQKKQKKKSTRDEIELRNRMNEISRNDTIHKAHGAQSIINLQSSQSRHKQAENIYKQKTQLMNSNTIEPTPSNNDIDKRRKVEKQLHSESFQSQNIWDEIISNNPVKLEAHTEMNSEVEREDNEPFNSQALRNQRTHNSKPKTAIVIVTNKNQTENNNKKEEVSVLRSDDEGSENDAFEATVLREAYEDACLKVVIRKCYKACKAAGKHVCHTYHCDTKYNTKYTEMAKKGCLKEFDKKDKKKKFLRRFIAEAGNKTNGYLESCLPHIEAELRNSDNATRAGAIRTALVGRSYQNLALFGVSTAYSKNDLSFQKLVSTIKKNIYPVIEDGHSILRDKYEDACRDLSYNKCIVACSYTYKETCQYYECHKDKKKAYSKECKNECKAAYMGNRKRNSDSSDSDSSSSDSDDTDVSGKRSDKSYSKNASKPDAVVLRNGNDSKDDD